MLTSVLGDAHMKITKEITMNINMAIIRIQSLNNNIHVAPNPCFPPVSSLSIKMMIIRTIHENQDDWQDRH